MLCALLELVPVSPKYVTHLSDLAMNCAHACIFLARPRDAALEEMANPDTFATDMNVGGGTPGLPDQRPRNQDKPKKEKKEKSLEQVAQSV